MYVPGKRSVESEWASTECQYDVVEYDIRGDREEPLMHVSKEHILALTILSALPKDRKEHTWPESEY